MAEVVNVLVAFAVIVFVVRWATSGEKRTVLAAEVRTFNLERLRQGLLCKRPISSSYPRIQAKDSHS